MAVCRLMDIVICWTI